MKDNITTNVAPLIRPSLKHCYFCDQLRPVIAYDVTIEGGYICDDCVEDSVIVDVTLQVNGFTECKERPKQL